MDKAKCPCCGQYTLDEADVWEICDNCGWEDDPVHSSDPNLAGGANHLSLNDARKVYAERMMREVIDGR